MKVEILDCTIRDGGYYCEWDFDDAMVVRLLDALERSGVSWVEIGFRSNGADGFSGKYNFCRDEFLQQLFSGRKIRLAVMIDGKNFITKTGIKNDLLDELFCPKSQSRIDLVRITSTVQTFPSVLEVAGLLSAKGYRTAVNVMQASMLTAAEIQEIGKLAEASPIDMLYLADSFGGLAPDETRRLFKALRSTFSRHMGFHSHDNLGMALANSLAAIESGASIIDSSLTGMGRGAGNLRTEQLLVYLSAKEGMTNLDPAPLFDVATNEMAALQQEYGWGPSLPYMLSAVYNVHPMYPQRILQVNRYTPMEVVNTLATIKASKSGASFNDAVLAKALQQRFHGPVPTDQIVTLNTDRHRLPVAPEGGAALIVGSGPSTAQRAGDINAFIRANAPLVIECNYHRPIAEATNHHSLFTNFRQLEQNLGEALENRKSILLGIPEIPRSVAQRLQDHGFQHYPYDVRQGRFEVYDDRCVIPYDVVAMYAFAVAIRSRARTIYLCGFDGYHKEIERSGAAKWRKFATMEKEMEEFFRLLKASESLQGIRVVSLTPTAYDLQQQSLYAFV